MALTEQVLPDGVFHLSDREIKVDEFDCVAALTWAIEHPEAPQNVIMITASGRLNNGGDERDDVTLLLSVDDARALVANLNYSLAAVPPVDGD